MEERVAGLRLVFELRERSTIGCGAAELERFVDAGPSRWTRFRR